MAHTADSSSSKSEPPSEKNRADQSVILTTEPCWVAAGRLTSCALRIYYPTTKAISIRCELADYHENWTCCGKLSTARNGLPVFIGNSIPIAVTRRNRLVCR